MNNSEFVDGPEAGAGGGGFIGHLPAIFWQRRWLIIIPFVLGIIAAVLTALLVPPLYRSSAKILVESPQLSGAIIGDDGPEIIDRRIARIREQATSRPDLVALIEKYGLYKDDRERKPLSEVIEMMRSAIVLAPVSGDMAGTRPDEKTISIQLSFDYREARPAQAVAQELMQRLLELDSTGNAEQATNKVQFLTEQAKDLDRRIKDVQGKIAEINIRNGGILSDSGTVMLGGNSGSYDVQIASLQRDTASLIAQRNTARSSDQRDPAVTAAQSQLAAARAVYTENHPDVVLAKARLAEARELAKSNTEKLPMDSIDDQIAFNNSQIGALRAAKAQELGQMSSALSARSRAPLVQQQITDLQQQLTGLNTQSEAVSSKLLAARAGVRAEDEQMGERLAVVEPPIVPDTPIWPNRLLIAAVGIGGGLGLGLVLALAMELFLRPIRDPGALAAIVGSSPLAVIPPIKARPLPKNNGRTPSIFARFWPGSR